MPRTFIVTKKTSLDALGKTMLDARFQETQAAAALNELREANRHVDPANVAPGTVIVVPNTPGFKQSAGEPVSKGPRDSLRALLQGALERAVQESSAGLQARATERAEVAKALKSTAFRNATDLPDATKQQFEEAAKAMADDAKKDEEAAERLAATSGAALAALARLDTLDR